MGDFTPPDGSAYRDPFDKEQHITVKGPWKNFTLYAAKLDWLLLRRGMESMYTEIGGEGLSDHLYCLVDVIVTPKDNDNDNDDGDDGDQ